MLEHKHILEAKPEMVGEQMTWPRIEGEYVVFQMMEMPRKTQIWSLFSQRHGNLLGVIKWYGPWRQYCFYPEKESVWSLKCLHDVKEFLQTCNKVWRDMQVKKRQIPPAASSQELAMKTHK
jgi:hypothetical protein